MTNTELLNHIRKTTDMGSYGIQNVVTKAKNPDLRRALRQQDAEYQSLYREADRLLMQTGGKQKNSPPGAKMASKMSAEMSTMMDRSDSKIAELMIRGNVMGEVKSMRYLRKSPARSPEVGALTEKLLKTEQDNVAQMKKFL